MEDWIDPQSGTQQMLHNNLLKTQAISPRVRKALLWPLSNPWGMKTLLLWPGRCLAPVLLVHKALSSWMFKVKSKICFFLFSTPEARSMVAKVRLVFSEEETILTKGYSMPEFSVTHSLT